MTQTLAKFNVQLLASLKALQNRLEDLNAKSAAGVDHAETEIHAQIKALEHRAADARASLAKARDEVLKWADEPAATVTAWKAKFDEVRLAERAARATRYAEAAAEILRSAGEIAGVAAPRQLLQTGRTRAPR